jgi:hypothetical protein
MTIQEARKLLPDQERLTDSEINKLLAENYAIANLAVDTVLSSTPQSNASSDREKRA